MNDIRRISYNSDAYQAQVKLRYEVLRAPLGLSFSVDFLLKDQTDLMFGLYLEDELSACCQLSDIGAGIFQLRQMAVATDKQGKNLGKILIAYVEQYILDVGGQKIILHARQTATGFYEKLGYHIDGDQFMEINIPHYIMQKQLV